ncbi:proton-conducting transporter membrane subunit [Flexithrix dorotheae]|uniref:proton-conducting transporter transmembrane domain-containing protein n=1 Tax=Flexithrix dorotheae TaxID=70993 RepID=UPI0003608D7E|nr:proton-conducting transporter membrane subunit [Flexithrix dorotheae]
MENTIHLFIVIPLVGFITSLLIPYKGEALISKVAFTAVGLNLMVCMAFIPIWAIQRFPALNIKDLSIYQTANYDFFIDFYFDEVSAIYLLVGAILTFLVTIYSRYYLHRESGYKRFFSTILFFYLGFNITILSGNFETLFIGWEILGISSFLLIAFYRNRHLPVKNAVKVFTIYRIGDVGILLAIWMSHHLWHENITFQQLTNYELVQKVLSSHYSLGIFISLMILIAAAAKSAQLPFSAWLPRAMEGPTPSSAIFYGSLSVHIGAFLLMRTFPFWEHQFLIRVLIGGLGLSTTVITSLIARVQPTIKSQIAYASAAQIGIIFFEIAIGLEKLALFHFAGNAFFRTYQLLISPSVVTYLIREQFYNFVPDTRKIKNNTYQKLRNTIYLLSLKEWHLDSVIFRFFFKPLKKTRKVLGFLNLKNLLYFFVPLYLGGFYFSYINQPASPEIRYYLAVGIAFLALLMVVKAFNERTSSRLAWLLIALAHFFIDLSITFNDQFNAEETFVYLSGVFFSGILGYGCLHKIKAFEHHGIGLNQFHGLVHRYRLIAFLFLLSSLGLAGFPITSTFFGEDIILTHIHEDQMVLAFIVALTFIITGISVIRIYARIFLGPHIQFFQEKPELTA